MNSPSVNFTLPTRRKKKKVCCRGTTAIQHRTTPIDSGFCDCLEKDCPGCFNPCEKCGSIKCGSECRIGRPWKFEKVVIQGE